ncbi:MAG: VOC family protein [Chloroflexi bacterium]|nr:MAG: VOC family protein [Chloroflexota bacterium]MBL1194788.1 VOC family protein [Chloroflexota bacterium]NOH12080.1 VOC family protein [Chloroflexota bacterium]
MPNVCLIEIMVPDVEAARQFYCDKLGFDIRSEAYLPDVLVLEHEGADLILIKTDKPSQLDYPHEATSVLVFEVEDIHLAEKEYKSRGVEFIREIGDAPPGLFTAFRDPWGNVHGLMQIIPRE